ncbi:Asp/Glu/hydantoin racemase [Acetobacteraceae bacterium H6797]|nr:Asp/Glu/hydantoin racemase [Acetobacteraceae bacterium H6797]
MPHQLMHASPRLIGTITPSANTVVERTSQSLLADLPGVVPIFSRVPVRGSQDPFPDAYNLPAMLEAAALLADAKPEVIVWNGSKGGAIGFDHDRDLVERIEQATGIPADTSGLALLRQVKVSGARRFGLITPYAKPYQDRLIAQLAREGIEIVAESHLGMTDNLSYATVPYHRILNQASEVAEEGPEVIIAWCTNYPAAPLSRAIEAETSTTFWDATALGLWGALDRMEEPARPAGWGSLFA